MTGFLTKVRDFFLVLIIILFTGFVFASINSCAQVSEIPAHVEAPPPQPTPEGDGEKHLKDHIHRTMEVVHAPLTPAMAEITTKVIARVAQDTFSDDQARMQWVTLLAIESHFVNGAKSKAGAIGIGQLMPGYVADFGAICGLPTVTKDDAQDLTVNATLSACVFNHLLKQLGSVNLALAAYNAGLSSEAVKGMRKLTNVNIETSNYIARFAYVTERSKP